MPTPRATPIDGGEKLEDITGFCLSGGGYRAMLFHAGAIFRMNELGLLKTLSRVSSVSGGSMTAAALALAYPKFQYDAKGSVTNLTATFLKPVLDQAADSIDVSSAFGGLNPFSSAAREAGESYDRNITKGVKLAQVTANPTFVFNATSLMTGVVMRFRSDYVADYHIGTAERARYPAVRGGGGFRRLSAGAVADRDRPVIGDRRSSDERPARASSFYPHGGADRWRRVRQHGHRNSVEALPQDSGQQCRQAVRVRGRPAPQLAAAIAARDRYRDGPGRGPARAHPGARLRDRGAKRRDVGAARRA